MYRLIQACMIAALFGGSAAAQTCGPHTPPAIAASYGFTCETFWDDFTSLSTFDMADTLAPGFNWYLRRFNTITEPTAGLSIVPGGLRLNPATVYSDIYGLYNIGSCTAGAESGGNLVGKRVAGPMYVELVLSEVFGDDLGPWWPAFWMLGEEQIKGTVRPYDSPEIDLREHASGGSRNLHRWHLNADFLTQEETYTYYAGIPSFSPGEKLGVLILSPELNGGVGLVRGYYNDTLYEPHDVTWAPGGLYSEAAIAPMCLLFGTGANEPVTLRSWRIWQAPNGTPPVEPPEPSPNAGGGGVRRR
jgi:hypothetical protein